MTTRLLFMCSEKIIESAITLQFDCNLDPVPDYTVIYTNVSEEFDLLGFYREQGIQTDNFRVVYDQQLLQRYADTGIWMLNGWLRQQIIKLVAIDETDDQQILIQDCDTFSLVPYQYFRAGNPVNYVLYNDTHSPGYYKYIKKFTGKRRVTEHCFVTEFSPILKSEWTGLKTRIESKFDTDWASAIIRTLVSDAEKAGGKPVWFSEYELLGNWCTYQNPAREMIGQHRLELFESDIEKIKLNTYRFENTINANCVCFIKQLKPYLDVSHIPMLVNEFKKL